MTGQLLARLRGRFSRGLVLESAVWTWLMVVGTVLRATSYWYRPPAFTPTTARIEGVLSYPAWTATMVLITVLLIAGTLWRELTVLAWVGNVLGVVTAAMLASSIYGAAILDGEPWSGGWPLVVIALIHAGRANALGPTIRRQVLCARP